MMMALAAMRDLPCVLVPGGVTLPPRDGEDAGKVQSIGARFGEVNVLVNNAGAWFTDRRVSSDGIELTFATNVLGPHLLTELLLPQLRAATRARVVNLVSSIAARPETWRKHVAFSDDERHYVELHRDTHVDVWLLCWTPRNDTGWHDHDISSGAVAVLTDLIMPGVDGSKLIDAIKTLSPQTPAILFSGKVRIYDRDTQADVFLPKGMYAPSELLERIRLLLVRKRGPKRTHPRTHPSAQNVA